MIPLIKKLKHLRTTILEYAQVKMTPGSWPDELTQDHKFVEDLEARLMMRKHPDSRARQFSTGEMKECNRLYKKYRDVYDGRLSKKEQMNIEMKMHEHIEEFLIMGQKINAIKEYRMTMEKLTKIVPGLRESKDYVDEIQSELKKTGKRFNVR